MLLEDFITNIYERVQLWRYLCVRGTIRKKSSLVPLFFPRLFPRTTNGVMPPYGPYARYRTGTIANGWYVQVPVCAHGCIQTH